LFHPLQIRSQEHAENPDLVNSLLEKVDRFLQGRSARLAKSTFDKYADPDKKLIMPNSFREALGDLGVQMTAEEALDHFAILDADNNGGLEFSQFQAGIIQPSSQVQQFVNTLPLHGMLASLLSTESSEPLKDLCDIDPGRLAAAIKAFSLAVHQTTKEALIDLKGLVAAMETKAGEEGDGSGGKYQVISMSAGSVEDYHKGMYARTGPPNLKIAEGMKNEHTVLACCKDEFTSTNYGITTSPLKEFEIATGRRPCPEEDMKDRHGHTVRTLRSVDALRTLEICIKAGLTDEEILAVVGGRAAADRVPRSFLSWSPKPPRGK